MWPVDHGASQDIQLNTSPACNLCRGTGDEEPFVYRAVNLLGGKLLVGRNGGQLVGIDAARGVSNSDVGAKRLLLVTEPTSRDAVAKREREQWKGHT